jgi:hypothetical protein
MAHANTRPSAKADEPLNIAVQAPIHTALRRFRHQAELAYMRDAAELLIAEALQARGLLTADEVAATIGWQTINAEATAGAGSVAAPPRRSRRSAATSSAATSAA